jgi:hypothetical protein
LEFCERIRPFKDLVHRDIRRHEHDEEHFSED